MNDAGLVLDELLVGDAPEAWAAAGFTIDPDGRCRIGTVAVRLVGRENETGVLGWSLRGLPTTRPDVPLDGVPTTRSGEPVAPGPVHPNGVTGLDHVVLLSPDLRRTVAALGEVGLEPRRERDGVLGGSAIRQVFFRFANVILEVVGAPGTVGEGPSTVWGLTHVVADIDAAAAFFGDRTSPVKDAVQPGRRITTLRHRELDLSVRTALITPHGARTGDRGPEFDGVRIGRPATGALIDAGYRSLADLPDPLASLLDLHGVGPRAVRLLDEARAR